jgi:hypothetical protein
METQLARDILHQAFGGLVYPVADLLIQRYPGSAPLSAILAHGSPATPSTVRQALLILLRHNLVKVSRKVTDRGSGLLVYALRLPQVITRLNFPEYGNQALELYGNIVSRLCPENCV